MSQLFHHSTISLSLAALSLFWILAGLEATWTTNPRPGVLCGDRRCLGPPTPAECVNQTCVCKRPNNNGLGTLFCVDPDSDDCYIYSDPLVQTFSHVKYHRILMLLRYRMTHVLTKVCSSIYKKHHELTCQTRVNVWGRRFKGKSYAQGVEVRYHFSNNRTADYFFYGDVVNGTYTFTRYGNLSSSVNVPGYGQTRFSVDSLNKLLIIDGPCGVRIFFRPVDPYNQNQFSPGMAISVSRRCDPHYVDPGHFLCGKPYPHNQTDRIRNLTDVMSTASGISVRPALAALLWTLQIPSFQLNFGGSPVLNSLNTLALTCPTAWSYVAVPWCGYLLTQTRFLKCLVRQSGLDTASLAADNLIFQLFYDCWNIFCYWSVSLCQAFQLNHPCASAVDPVTDTMLSFNCSLLASMPGP